MPEQTKKRTSGSLTGRRGSCPGSYERLVCWQFIEEYAGSFANHFDRCFQETLKGTLMEGPPPVSGAELYCALFTEYTIRGSDTDVRELLIRLVKHTFQAEKILTLTFLHMIKDVAGCLINRNGMLCELDTIIGRIHDVSGLLFEVYYNVSRPVVVSVPAIDRYTAEYQEILKTFGQYLKMDDTDKRRADLKIHTYYHSIPIDLKANVQSVGPESVTFDIHPYEAVALSHLGMAIIKSPLHNAVFRAYSSHVDIKNQTATFSHLVYTDETEQDRSHIRVQPGQPVITRIISPSSENPGIIYDISETSATVYIRNIDIKRYEPGNTVRFLATLPDNSGSGAIEIDTQAKVLVLYKEEKGDPDAYRIAFEYDDKDLRSRLSMYISQRQVEIIRELKELSHNIE